MMIDDTNSLITHLQVCFIRFVRLRVGAGGKLELLVVLGHVAAGRGVARGCGEAARCLRAEAEGGPGEGAGHHSRLP